MVHKMPKPKANPLAVLPPAILDKSDSPCAETMKPGESFWGRVVADSKGQAFVISGARLLPFQDPDRSPHFLIAQADGSIKARLMNQRVEQVAWEFKKSSYGVMGLTEVELQ